MADTPEDATQEAVCFAVGTQVAQAVRSGAITLEDLTIEGPTYSASATGELTYYRLNVGPYDVALIHSTGKGHRTHGITVEDRGIQIGRWFSNDETSGPAIALTAVRELVDREIEVRRATVLRRMADREL